MKRHVFTLLFSLIFTVEGFAQNASEKAWFTANEAIGCSEFTVQITNLGVRPGNLFVDFQGDPNDRFSGSGFSQTFSNGQTISFTYSTPGSYLIRVVDQTGGGSTEDRFDFLTIEVIEPVEPSFSTNICRNNEVALTFDFGADSYDLYEIDFGDGTIINYNKAGANTITHSYGSQGEYDIRVRGQLSPGDDSSCGVSPVVTLSTLDNIPVPNLLRISSLSEQSVELQYEALNPNIAYQLQMNNGSGFQDLIAIDPIVNPTDLVIPDGFNNLTDSYTFRIVASDPCGSEEISSQASTIAINYQLTDITDQINVSYSWQTNELTSPMEFYQNGSTVFPITDLSGSNTLSYGNCTEIGSFYIEKSIGGIIVRSLTLNPFENQNLDLPAPNPPAGALIDNNVELTFDAPPFAFSLMEVYRKDGGGIFNSIGTTSDLSFTDFGVSGNLTEACYLITYIDECGNRSLQSAETCIPVEGLLRTPNAFSPNGDGINDTFDVGRGVFTNFRMLIYNKWGNLVFQGNDPTNGWDGRVSGQEAPTGTYYYKISYVKNGVELINTGTVTLIR